MTLKFTTIFLFFAVAFAASIQSYAEESPHPGPRSKAEPGILYADGEKALAENQPEKAINAYKRLISRYPLDSHFIDAHLKLGEAYLQAGQPKEAIEPFAAYIKHHFKDDLGNQARLKLTDAYLQAKKYSEARGMTEETLKRKTSEWIQNQALLLKSLVLARQQKLNDAKSAFDAYLKDAQDSAKETANAANEALENKVRFILKTEECRGIPLPKEPKSKNESLWVQHLQNLKTCFKESLTLATVPKFEIVVKEQQQEWCYSLRQKQADVTAKSHDRSFLPKIKESFDEIKSVAKEKSKELLQCYEQN